MKSFTNNSETPVLLRKNSIICFEHNDLNREFFNTLMMILSTEGNRNHVRSYDLGGHCRFTTRLVEILILCSGV